MAWEAIRTKVRGKNGTVPDFTTPGSYREVVLDLLSMPPYWLPEEDLAPGNGIGARLLQNVSNRMYMEWDVRSFSLRQGEWDFGDYMQCVRCFQMQTLWIVEVDESADLSSLTATDDDGNDYDFWVSPLADALRSILPLEVQIRYGQPEFDSFASSHPMHWPMQVVATLPTIGMTIPEP